MHIIHTMSNQCGIQSLEYIRYIISNIVKSAYRGVNPCQHWGPEDAVYQCGIPGGDGS